MPNKDNQERYQADRKDQKRNSNNNNQKDTNKKIGKMASKAAANYFTGGKGGKVVDKLANTKLGDAAMQKMGDSFVKKNPGIGKIANKLNDSGMLDNAEKLTSLGDGLENIKKPSLNNTNNKKANHLNEDLQGENDTESSSSDSDSTFSSFGMSTLKFMLKHKEIAFPILSACFIGFIILMSVVSVLMVSSEDGSASLREEEQDDADIAESCSAISIRSTSLTKSQFAEKLEAKANSSSIMGYKYFAAHSDTIYDISVKNNINPEMVVIRAAVEGFSPGSAQNNYWGMGCYNSGSRCISYSSFSEGVLGYIKNISQYDSVESMMSRYASLGTYWLSPGDSSHGGCYYYPYIKKYMSTSRSDELKDACSKSCSGSSCMRVNDEDKKAYQKYQVDAMANRRSDIFGIGADKCESSDKDTSGGKIGKKAVEYAIKTFDSFSYSQPNRNGPSSVDCSSLVTRTYSHFNINIAGVAAEEYRWCESKGKTIKEKNLAPGDLIFFSQGSYSNAERYKNIGHVAIYIGNNKQFAAHSARYPQPDQVSVTSYTRGVGSYFCRPYK